MVGAERFELPTYWSQTSRATRLRYAPYFNRCIIPCLGKCWSVMAFAYLCNRDLRRPDHAAGRGILSLCIPEDLFRSTPRSNFIQIEWFYQRCHESWSSYDRLSKEKEKWSGRRDSNSRPTGPKPAALPDCATPRFPILGIYRVLESAGI